MLLKPQPKDSLLGKNDRHIYENIFFDFFILSNLMVVESVFKLQLTYGNL